jgi:hypothetical protein
MRIAMIGAGGIGGYIGAGLTEAGGDVNFIARGAQPPHGAAWAAKAGFPAPMKSS